MTKDYICCAMSKPSLAEMMAGYSKQPVELLKSFNQLPKGSSTGEILGKLMSMRQLGVLPVRPSNWGAESCTIGVCLIVVDRVHHEDIWRLWSADQSSSGCRVKFYIHAKHPENITSAWAREFLVDTRQKPEWNSPEVVRAMLAVLSCAVNDSSPCERYLFATESCIPVCSLRDACAALFKEDASWLEATNIPKTNWEHIHCFSTVDPTVIPVKAVWKAVPGWIVLNRRHATELVNLNSFTEPLGDLVRAWGPPGPWSELKGGVFAPEEVFFPTMLALLGYLDSNRIKLNEAAEANNKPVKSPREVRIKSAMYAEFERNGDANPRSFDALTESFVSQCRREGYLFARKFRYDSVSVEEWSRLVLGEATLPPPFTSTASASSSIGYVNHISGRDRGDRRYDDKESHRQHWGSSGSHHSYRDQDRRSDRYSSSSASYRYSSGEEGSRNERRDRSRERSRERDHHRHNSFDGDHREGRGRGFERVSDRGQGSSSGSKYSGDYRDFNQNHR